MIIVFFYSYICVVIDSRTISEFKDGSIKAFGQIYRAYSLSATRFAVRYVCNESVAQDIVQDVFISIWESRANIDPSRPIEAYIITSVRNRCINWIRETLNDRKTKDTIMGKMLKISMEQLESRNPVIDDVLLCDLRENMDKALRMMPEKTREAFVLNRFNNMSYQQIAERQGVSEKNIEYRIMSALKILRTVLKDYR